MTKDIQVAPDAFDVFISHNTKDKPIIRELADALLARGLQPWLDVEQIPPGASFRTRLKRA